jgi:uncharacterized protein with ATP-grasp and redox domains
MVDKFKAGLACAVVLYICENAGEALQNRPLVKTLAYGACAACGSVITYESSVKVREALEAGLPVLGKSIQNIGRRIMKKE